MQIEVFALCDAATGDAGKLNVLGAFDTLWVSKFPAVHAQCTVALRVRFSRLEKGEHQVKVSFIDMDGKEIIPSLQGAIHITFPEDQSSGSANLIMNIQGLKLEKVGEHAIDLSIDNQQTASLPLFVRKKYPPAAHA